MTGYLPGAEKKRQGGKPGTPVSGKGRERRVGHCGRERRLFVMQAFLFLRFIGSEKGMLAWQCAGRVGEALAVRFTVNGRSGQAVRLADGRARDVAENGRQVSQTRNDPCSHGKARIGNDND